MSTKYGIKINLVKSGERVFPLPQPYEFRGGEPVFALSNGDGSSNLETASSIRRNWNGWVKEYFRNNEKMTVASAQAQGYEIL